MGALWLALDLASPEERSAAPKYMLANAERLFDEKAGLLKPLAVGKAAQMGTEREHLLFRHSRLGRENVQAWYGPAVLPPEMQPMVCRSEPRLTTTLEAWERLPDGRLRYHELKCCRDTRPTLRWYWRLQCIAGCLVIGAEEGHVITGPGWALDAAYPEPDLPEPIEFPVSFNEWDEGSILEAVACGWKIVTERRDAWLEWSRLNPGKTERQYMNVRAKGGREGGADGS